MAMGRVKWSNVEEDDEMGNSGRSEENVRPLEHSSLVECGQTTLLITHYRTVSGWRLVDALET